MVELKYNHEWLAAKIKPPSKKTWTKRKLKLNSVGLSFPSDSAQDAKLTASTMRFDLYEYAKKGLLRRVAAEDNAKQPTPSRRAYEFIELRV